MAKKPPGKPQQKTTSAPAASARGRVDDLVELYITSGLTARRRSGPAGSGAWPLGSGAWPLGSGAWPVGSGAWPLGSGAWPLGDGAGPLGVDGRRLTVALGWHPDLPDCRDLQIAEDIGRTKYKEALSAGLKGKALHSRVLGSRDGALPPTHDLRNQRGPWPVEEQGALNSCTANAVVGMVEFLMWQGKQLFEDLSRLFLYKVTRQLLGWTEDTGAYLRTTIKALALFGAPPEQYWPYELTRFNDEPDAFTFGYASNYKAMKYARLDNYPSAGGSVSGDRTLDLLKRTLLDGFPVAFGFPVYTSLSTTSPDIPIPTDDDRLRGGHAVLAVGYDDTRAVIDPQSGRPDLQGAIIIRNSWGRRWGEDGYGYLPYRYVTDQLAVDFWTVFAHEWIDPMQFQ